MANQIYDAGLDALLNGDVDWLTDDIKVVLVDAADYTVDVSSDAHLDDIPAPARISTSGNLASKTVLMGALGAADTSFSSVSGDEFEAAVVYADTGVESTSTLLAYIDTGVGFPFTPDGGTVTLAWDSGTVIDFGLTQRIILAFDTEADRLAAVPQDGTLGWQTDTASLYVYVDGATPGWQPVGGSSVVDLPDLGDVSDALAPDAGDRLVFDGTEWVSTAPEYVQFVYNSSGVQDGNLYTDWAELMAVIGNLAGPKLILFQQNETIPAGSWNLDDVVLRGNGLEYNAGGYTLTFGDSTTISSWTNPQVHSLRLLSTSTTGPVWSPTGPVSFSITTLAHIHSTTEPFISHSGSGQVVISLRDSGRFLLLAGGVENFETSAPAFNQIVVYRGDNTVIDNNTLASTNPVVFIDIVGSVVNDLSVGSYPSTHTNLSIGFGLGLYLTAALALGFNPSGLAVVTGAEVQTAIEELDAAVDGHISDATDAHDASAISFDPTGLAVISGTDVQTALEELDAAGGGGGGGGAGTINQATYVYTGASETWTVPAGVTAVSVTCLGGPGGADTVGNDTAFMGNACVTGIVEVTPSTDVTIYVGGAGEDGNGSGTSAGGFPDGGDGAKGAGAGGGSSWIEQSAVKLILAAGNGGNGGNGGGAGGFGGTEVGGNGGDSSGSGGGNGGIGASIIAGGTGGTGGGGGTDGSDGSSGAGGAGGAAGDGNVRGGGGGGGGLYGGGGGEGGNGSGDGGGGGGGGSSLVPTGGYSFVAVSSVKRDGLVVLSWVE